MSDIVFDFIDHIEANYDIKILETIKCDGVQHRYKCEGDKGASKSAFVTFYLDDNPMAVFGHWKKYGKETFKWYYRDQDELSQSELKKHKEEMRKRAEENRRIQLEKQKQAAIRSGELWQLPNIGVNNFPYLTNKKCGAYGVKFFDNKVAFDYFASDERKEKLANGEIQIYDGQVMVVPVLNAHNQLVSLQQISANGKFKGFMPNGMKKGCFHKIPGDDSIVFLVEGYATGATIHELTGCTVYIAFDCGNLTDVAGIVASRHMDDVRIIASDNDRFTLTPINNPGQTKAKEVCAKFGFFNLKPNFHEGQEGTDWNDLLMHYPFAVVKNHMRKRLEQLFEKFDL